MQKGLVDGMAHVNPACAVDASSSLAGLTTSGRTDFRARELSSAEPATGAWWAARTYPLLCDILSKSRSPRRDKRNGRRWVLSEYVAINYRRRRLPASRGRTIPSRWGVSKTASPCGRDPRASSDGSSGSAAPQISAGRDRTGPEVVVLGQRCFKPARLLRASASLR
jgi:hypothetical protein